jgi:tetratricopeptide (TPR) repeat protein
MPSTFPRLNTLPISVFLLTAVLGVWTAYDPASAQTKFGLLAAGIVLYYFLQSKPVVTKPRWVAGAFTAMEATLALYFLFTTDWTQTPADLGFLNRIGLAWMKIRPALPTGVGAIHPNITGGLLAAFLPLGLASSLAAWKNQRRMAWLALIATGLAGLGLLMTSSRAAWGAFIAGMGLWLWWVISKRLAGKYRRELIFGVPVLLAVIVASLFAYTRFNSLLNLANGLPGAASAGSRAEIAWNTFHLSRDYLFTGGGLAAFPGLYARYLRIIPVYEYGYSHNLYLDLLLEQGIFGLGAFLWIAVSSLGLAFLAMRRNQPLAAAVFAGLAILLLHGFADDSFYGIGGTPLLFALPGLAASFGVEATLRSPGSADPEKATTPKARYSLRAALLPVVSVILLAIIGSLPVIRSGLLANLAALEMGHLQLTGWPNVAWYDPNFVQAVQPTEALFRQALELDPHNVTALYRLGLIALERRQFDAAADTLASAYQQAPGHRGIRKLLGYARLWQGQTDKAAALLADLPEISQELDYYAWWWGSQDQPNLAVQAQTLLTRIQP